jgi:hypothetical protein
MAIISRFSGGDRASTRDAVLPHAVFWEPSMPEFWLTADLSVPRPGFPCFLAFLYRAVLKGERGGEDASHILDDVIYLYPDTLPTPLQEALIGGVVSFTTFSRLNLDALLTSFSWSDSEIAIESLQLADGNYILFCLKMPQFYSQAGVHAILKQSLEAYKMTDVLLTRELSSADIPGIQQIFRDNQLIMTHYTFQPSEWIDDPFAYGARPVDSFPSKAALATATQLLDFMTGISGRIVGSAIFFRQALILSSLSHTLTSLLLLYGAMARRTAGHADEQFMSFSLWISPLVAGSGESPQAAPMTLAVAAWAELAFFILVVGHEEVTAILDEALALLANGMCDFAGECAAFVVGAKSLAPGIVAFWPETGIAKRSKCQPRTLQRMASCHDEFAAKPMLQEVTTSDGQAYVTGIRLPDVEVFVETDVKGPSQAIVDIYTKMKTFLPNLPDDLMKL